MLELTTTQYALISKALMHGSNAFKSDTDVGRLIAEAISILKRSAKGVPSTIQMQGASASASASKTKIKELFEIFGIRA